MTATLDSHQCRAVAARIGRRLCRDALWDHDLCTWLHWQQVQRDGGTRIVYRGCGADFPGGTFGIGLFLRCLADAVPDEMVRTTADAALRHARLTTADAARAPAFEALAITPDNNPLALLRTQLRAAETRTELEAVPRRLLQDVANQADGMIHASLADGWCGVFDALLWYEAHWPDAQIQEWVHARATTAAERYHVIGLPWPCGGPPGIETPGMAHGLAGIGWLYLRLADPLTVESPFALRPDARPGAFGT